MRVQFLRKQKMSTPEENGVGGCSAAENKNFKKKKLLFEQFYGKTVEARLVPLFKIVFYRLFIKSYRL